MSLENNETQGHWLARTWWVSIGLCALVLGAIGVVVPGLPTTVFVLIAAYCFSKSSPRLHGWLLAHRLFGPIITDWQERGAIAPRYKAMAVGMMVLLFALSLWLSLALWVLVLQVTCMTGAAIYILTRPSH